MKKQLQSSSKPNPKQHNKYCVYISAGEPSGDLAGAHLMRALRSNSHHDLDFIGIGGERMIHEGLQSIFPMDELSVMGFIEILPRLLKLKRRLLQTLQMIEAKQPHVIVSIDSPGFHFALARRLKKNLKTRHIPVIHYVAPSVWAWRAGRAKKVAGFLDHLLTLFPFEPAYFEKHGLASTCVGHFATERDLPPHIVPERTFRKDHAIAPKAPIVCLLPGSRESEVKTLLPIFLEAAKILQKKHPQIDLVIPTLDHLKPTVEQIVAGRAAWLNNQGLPPRILVGDASKWSCFEYAQAALAASGTVTLELAQTGTPTVIGYRVNPITAWLLKRFLTVPFVGLVNIIVKRRVVPELLQERCRPQCLAEVMEYVLFDEQTRAVQKEAFAKVVKMIRQPSGHSPSEAAAKVIIGYFSKKSNEKLRKQF